ncbi:MAG: AGE family epimerase/isomerase, partial [Gemmatimonadota bacterium]
MNANATVESLERAIRAELTERILPFWGQHALDPVNGGYHGRIGADGTPDPHSPRGGILNARILWAFSAAHRALGNDGTRALADRARDEVVSRFLDLDYGGLYWMVDSRGRPLDDRKHVYAQAFAIYALAEHHRATGDENSLRRASDLFRLLDEHAHDPEHGGYHEAFARDWAPLADARLSARDLDAPKSENTHLHLLEALTTLYRVRPDPMVA